MTSAPAGVAPSATTTIENVLPRSWRRWMWRTTSSMSNGRSGMRIASAPPAMPLHSAMWPALRPMTSTTMTRLWDSAVVCRRSIASVTICTAVWKPKVKSVAERSLSIVLGTPTTLMIPSSLSRRATPSVSSPPMGMSMSIASTASVSWTFSTPPSIPYGFVREEPRIVPPRGRMPEVLSRSSGTVLPPTTPAQP